MIAVRVFELIAGPRTAKRVQLEKSKSIAAQLPAFSEAIGGPIEISSATFCTVRERKIDKQPLPTDVPFEAVGVTDGGFIVIVRKGSKLTPQREVKKEVRGVKVEEIAPLQVESNQPVSMAFVPEQNSPAAEEQIVPVGDSKEYVVSPAEIPQPEPTAALSDAKGPDRESILSLVREMENVKREITTFWERWRAELTHDTSKFEKESLVEVLGAVTRVTQQQDAVEKALGRLQQHTQEREQATLVLSSIFEVNKNLLNELSTARQKAHGTAQESFAAIMNLQERIEENLRTLVPMNSQKDSIQSTVAAASGVNGTTCHLVTSTTMPEEVFALHESLLQRFFLAMGQVTVTASEMLNYCDNLTEIYTAVSLKYNLRHTPMQEALQVYLHAHLPHLASAAPVICYLHEGREVEYVETVTLRSLGLHLGSPHTWLEVVLSSTLETPHTRYYYSSLVGLSQREKPKWLRSVPIEICRISALGSVCPRLGLRNPQCTEHDSHSLSKWRRSKAAALLLYHRPDLRGNMDLLLESYAGREETLLNLLTAREFMK
ncbi:hypothetical protein MOQ_009477 [Trypanosoma cruzi marinkellei]|uniref:Uncharacterized protein n=1 Tax=Trypanosoma cruzi marinkellei TaxID=85056 RepID=K2LVQ6_TRYCR|nr:hypothetical protein MOQ_009477 [Trypanosoma cruzi marinkellei]